MPTLLPEVLTAQIRLQNGDCDMAIVVSEQPLTETVRASSYNIYVDLVNAGRKLTQLAPESPV